MSQDAKRPEDSKAARSAIRYTANTIRSRLRASRQYVDPNISELAVGRRVKVSARQLTLLADGALDTALPHGTIADAEQMMGDMFRAILEDRIRARAS